MIVEYDVDPWSYSGYYIKKKIGTKTWEQPKKF